MRVLFHPLVAVTVLVLTLASAGATQAQNIRGTVVVNCRNSTTYFTRVSFLHRLCKGTTCRDVPVDSGPGSQAQNVDPGRRARLQVARQEYIKMRVQVLDACGHPFATADAWRNGITFTEPGFINWTLREIGKSQRFEITNP